MKIKKIILSLILALTITTGLLACKDPVDPPITGLTPEQQVQKIKDIYNGAHNAHFNKQVSPVNAFSVSPVNASSEEESPIGAIGEDSFNMMYAVISTISQTVVEEKTTEVLTKSYSITEETNLSNEVTGKLDGSLNNALIQLATVTNGITIHGQKDNIVYTTIEFVQGEDWPPSIDFIIKYNSATDYSITMIFPDGGVLTDKGTEILHFNKNTSEMFVVANYEDNVTFYDMADLIITTISKSDSTRQSEIQDIESKANNFINSFETAAESFTAKTETVVLMFI